MASQAASRPLQRPGNGSASILVVDADEGFATLLQESLERDQHRVTIATSDIQAIRALVSQRFDLAVVDLGLGDPGGAVLVRTLRRLQPGLRLVVVPLVGEDLPPELVDLKVQGVLPKPFFQPELAARIAAALAEPVPPRLRPATTLPSEEGEDGGGNKRTAVPLERAREGRSEPPSEVIASVAPARTTPFPQPAASSFPSAGGDGFQREDIGTLAAASPATAPSPGREGIGAVPAPPIPDGFENEPLLPPVTPSPQELPARPRAAAASVAAPAAGPEPRPAEDAQRTLVREMAELAREIGGAILIVPRELLPAAGETERAENLSATDRHGQPPLVWREQLRFEGHTGKCGVSYTLAVAGSDVVLSAMIQPGCPLGLLRERGRQMLTRLLTRR